MVERVLSNHSLMGTISQEILTFPFHDTILGINRQTWNEKEPVEGRNSMTIRLTGNSTDILRLVARD